MRRISSKELHETNISLLCLTVTEEIYEIRGDDPTTSDCINGPLAPLSQDLCSNWTIVSLRH